MEEKKKKSNLKGLRNRVWFFLNIFFTCIYLLWRFFFTIPVEYGLVSIIAGVSLFVVEFLGMFEAMIHYFNMHKVESYPLPGVPVERYPHVDIFIATYNESEDILYKTVNGCLYMDYPDKQKVHIYLCDDGRRPEMRALAERMGVNYLIREDNEHAKAGNLNHALSVTTSPYVVTFDADMIPHHDFLLKTIPYFVQNEMDNEDKEEKDQKWIGFVQTPQAFYNPDLFQFNLFSENRIPNEQDYFYRDIQVSRNRSNSTIYGGSNTVLSRRALDDIGGFYTGTITEDYATGILMQKKKYRCFAISDVLASGLSPTDLKSLIVQRNRWARGVIASNWKMHMLLTPHLTIRQKLNYWASKWYWYAPLKRLIYFLSPILYATFGYIVIKCTLWEILLFWLPMYISSNISLRMLSRNIRTTKWTSVYETVLFPYMLMPVILETFGLSLKTFKVTKKGDVENEQGKNLIYAIPFILLIILSVIGIINCVAMILDSGSTGPIVVFFWLVVNLFTLIMSTFFVLGRNFLRKTERARVEADCRLCISGRELACRTYDISEEGISVLLPEPYDIDDEEDVEIEVWTDRYRAALKARVVHVDKRDKQWKYAFRLVDHGDNYDQYLQMIYDRVPTLPQNLDSSSGSFDDLRINVTKRATRPFYENRRLPRITIKTDLKDTEGKSARLTDFNYKYLTVMGDPSPNPSSNPSLSANPAPPLPQSRTLILCSEPQVLLKCSLVRGYNDGRSLYRVDNYEEIHKDQTKRAWVEQWAFTQWGAAHMEQAAAPEVDDKKKPEEQVFNEMKHL